MRRALMFLAALFGLVTITSFGSGQAEAKRIKLSTVTGAYAAKKILTPKKDKEGQSGNALREGDDDDTTAATPTKAEEEARAAAFAAAKTKLAAEKAAEKRTETAVELASAKMPPNTGVVCLAGCMRPQ